MKLLPSILAGALALGATATAHADQVHYVGVHPLSHDTDDGFCYIEFAHIHVRAPAKKARVLYRVRDDRYYFVADPEPFGYDGEQHPYYGHHPVHHDGYDEPAFCYLDGPHYHVFAPAVATFELRGGAYWYVGELPDSYRAERRRYARVNAYYRPIEYARPVVEVEARPAAYVGPVVGVRVDAHAEVVVPPPPVFSAEFSIHAGLPGVVVHDHDDDHRHYRKRKAHKRVKVKHKHKRKHERKHRDHRRRLIRRDHRD